MIKTQVNNFGDYQGKAGFQAMRRLLDNVAALTQAWVEKTASYTIDPGFVCIWHILDGSAAIVAATLPDPEDSPGALAIFKCVDSTFACSVVGLIDGAASVSMVADDVVVLKASKNHGWCRLV